jgi:phage/plasmid primase-like uncharacterized protein
MNWDAIKQANPIADIIGQAIKLQKSGREYKACCPFHDEKTPSFHVIPDKGFAHCFGCGWHGDVVDFVRDYKKVSASEAVAMLTQGGANYTRDDTPEAEAERARIMEQRAEADRIRREMATNEARATWEAASRADPHHPYLVRKGVEPHMARQCNDGRLVLPIMDAAGKIMSVQLIADDGAKKFTPGAATGGGRAYIGINMGRTILCEGFATGASIYDAIPDQVCITYSLNNMERVARELHADGRAIVLASDGGNAAARMVALGAELDVPVIIPPAMPDGNDFNDQTNLQGTDAVAATFRNGLKAYSERKAMRDNAPAQDTGPVDLWAAPAVPELPRGLLPPIIERFAFESAAQMGTDPAGFAMSALAACSVAIRDSIQLKPKQHENWLESARIWVMLIGMPSTRKSPMMARTLARIKKLDANLLYGANKALADWQDNGGAKSGDPRPKTPRLRIEDATTEAAQEICKDSPDGIMVLQDELTGFFGRIEKYGGKSGGADRSFWLQAYGGGQYAVNRIGRGSFLIDNLSVTMLGGIQPGPLRSLVVDASDDGLIQRFIPVMLQKAERDKDIATPPVSEEFGDMIEALHGLETPRNFFGVQPLTFSEGARAVREALADEHFRFVLIMEQMNSKLATHIGKFDGLFVRLCVIWHCVENIGGDSLPLEVSESTATRVARFLTEYIRGHSVAFYIEALGVSPYDDLIKEVGAWILAHKVAEFTEGDLVRGVRAYRNADPIKREEAMKSLCGFDWCEPLDGARKDAKRWAVSIEVHQKYAAKAEAERIRRHEVKTLISDIVQEKCGKD